MRMRKVFLFEYDGGFYITDRVDLNRVRFETADARQKWVDKLQGAFPTYEVIQGRPDVLEELRLL